MCVSKPLYRPAPYFDNLRLPPRGHVPTFTPFDFGHWVAVCEEGHRAVCGVSLKWNCTFSYTSTDTFCIQNSTTLLPSKASHIHHAIQRPIQLRHRRRIVMAYFRHSSYIVSPPNITCYLRASHFLKNKLFF